MAAAAVMSASGSAAGPMGAAWTVEMLLESVGEADLLASDDEELLVVPANGLGHEAPLLPGGAPEGGAMSVLDIEERMAQLKSDYRACLERLEQLSPKRKRTPSPKKKPITRKRARIAAAAVEQQATTTAAKAVAAEDEDGAGSESGEHAVRRSKRASKLPEKLKVLDPDREEPASAASSEDGRAADKSSGQRRGGARRGSTTLKAAPRKGSRGKAAGKGRATAGLAASAAASESGGSAGTSPTKPRRKSKPKSPAGAGKKVGSASPDKDPGAPFHCEWPGCNRTFDKIKSRSAHLKWHGGGYKSGKVDKEKKHTPSPGAGSKPKKRRRTSAASSSSTASEAQLPCGTRVVMKQDCSFASLAGKGGVVKKANPGLGSAIWYQVRVTLRRGSHKVITVPAEHFEVVSEGDSQGDQGSEESDSPRFAVGVAGSFVFGLVGIKEYGRAEVGEVRSEDDGSCSCLLAFANGTEAWQHEDDLIPDVVPTISQLRVGMSVGAFSGPRATTLHVGRVQRVEPSRVRVKFPTSQPVMWRQLPLCRLLPDGVVV